MMSCPDTLLQWEKYKEYNEREKEELRLQIHDLELLLEEERQTFEENRKSVSLQVNANNC